MAKARLRQPLHLAFSYDEEVGCFGAHLLIDHLMRALPTPRAVIVGEPSNMNVVTAHKSAHDFQTVVKGRKLIRACHNLAQTPSTQQVGSLRI
ncbi:hypothetical protein ACOJBO_00560 [Rhizobium beringeri]